MPVIGTAGHVDHGKSTLVNALTGIDPDRSGGGEAPRPDHRPRLCVVHHPGKGREVGIVDVPGHERFIKNMLAGAGAINLNLFVVAANEGWKPQSQEHLDILHTLGISAAIVVVTKTDTVDDETLAAVRKSVAPKIEGTTLAGSPIIGVSATTGGGSTSWLPPSTNCWRPPRSRPTWDGPACGSTGYSRSKVPAQWSPGH